MMSLDMMNLLAQIGVMLAAALLFKKIAERIHCPAIFGELIAGVLLGPTFLGWLFPEFQRSLFPIHGASVHWREIIFQTGLLLFLFTAGLEVDLAHLKTRGQTAFWTSLLGIAVPFGLGAGLVILFPDFWAGHLYGTGWMPALFLGTALSITALPVIARILQDLRLLKTDFGTVVMTSAMIDDLIGWIFFSILLNQVTNATAGSAALFSKFMLLTVFFAGVLASRWSETWQTRYRIISRIISNFFVPLYFVSIGLKTNFLAHFDGPLVSAILGIAFLGKVLGATLGARWGKSSIRESWAIGFAMNARGAIGMVLASLAFQYHLIDEAMLVSLIFTALITSLASGPAINRLLRV